MEKPNPSTIRKSEGPILDWWHADVYVPVIADKSSLNQEDCSERVLITVEGFEGIRFGKFYHNVRGGTWSAEGISAGADGITVTRWAYIDDPNYWK